jgi:hypothetical protein
MISSLATLDHISFGHSCEEFQHWAWVTLAMAIDLELNHAIDQFVATVSISITQPKTTPHSKR